MIGIVSRFAPWGRPLQPYDIEVVVSDPADLSGLNPEEGTPFNGPSFILTNNGKDVVAYAASLILSGASNLNTDTISGSAVTISPGQSRTITPRFYTSNAGSFSGTVRFDFRLSAYSPEAWSAHNSSDMTFLKSKPAYKVSRFALNSPSANLSGSAYADN